MELNDLQRYLKLKGLDCLKLATEIGQQYYSVQKVVKGVRSTPHIREAIARHLGFSEGQLFGPRSRQFLRRQIQAEITIVAARSAAQTEEELKAVYLPDLTRSVSDVRKAVNV